MGQRIGVGREGDGRSDITSDAFMLSGRFQTTICCVLEITYTICGFIYVSNINQEKKEGLVQ